MRQPTFATPTGLLPVSAESLERLVRLLRAERWLQEVDAIEAAGVSKPIQLDRVGNKVVFSILVGFAVLPDDLAALRDALAHA